MAVPLDNGLFNVFMSYCIAGGFGQPEYDSPDGIDPSPFKTVLQEFVFNKKIKYNFLQFRSMKPPMSQENGKLAMRC